MLSRRKTTSRALVPLFILVLCFGFVLTMQTSSSAQRPQQQENDCCSGNLLRNGDFSLFNIAGSSNFPPSTVADWSRRFQSPQIESSPLRPGCDGKPGFIKMWGNKVVGEAVQQTNLAIRAGRVYRLSACVRVDTSNSSLPKYVRFNVRASIGQLSSYTASGLNAPTIGVIGDVTNTPPSTPQGIVATQWTAVTLIWRALGNYNTITINPENDSVRDDGRTVSWGDIDSLCIQEVRRGPGSRWQ